MTCLDRPFFLDPRSLFPHRRGVGALLWILLLPTLLVAAAGCLHDPTLGPLYSAAAPAKPGFARVYLYRVDPHHSYSTVEIRFDDQKPLQILDEEYITLELEEGTHEIAFRLRRRIGFSGWTWSAQRIRARAGEKIYFEITVQVTGQTIPAGRDLEIAGRGAGTAGEVASIRLIDESEAVEALGMTHLHVP